MSRINALSIKMADGSTAELLKEEYGKVIENIQAVTLANRLKNTDLSGDPTSGTVEAKRFVNVSAQAYGTARSGHAGQNVKADPVVIPLNVNTEYIEEVEEKDLRTYGVEGLIARRTKNHGDMLSVDLDTAFFAQAVSEGTSFTTTKSDIKDELEEAIETIETTKNNFVNGVPRNKINVICSPATYGAVRTSINAIANSNGLGQMANYEQGTFNNCRIFSSTFLPAGVDYIVMVDGAVAQPVMTNVYEPKKVDLSDATAFGLFVYKGTKAVMSDLIIYSGTAVSL